MYFDPATADPPLLAHSLPPVRDLDPGAIGGDDDVPGEDLGGYFEREIQVLDPAEEGDIICRFETRDECREFPDKALHLAVRHLEEGVNAGRPRNERVRVLKWPTTFAGVHLGEMGSPLVDEVTITDPGFKGCTPGIIHIDGRCRIITTPMSHWRHPTPLPLPYHPAITADTSGLYPEQIFHNVQKTARRPENRYQHEQLLLTLTMI